MNQETRGKLDTTTDQERIDAIASALAMAILRIAERDGLLPGYLNQAGKG